MAKIQFGDYLKSKKNKGAVYESDEAIAKRIKALIESDACVVQPRFRMEIFQKGLELVEQIPDHPDAASLRKRCLEGIAQGQEELIRTDLAAARYHLETATDEYEYQKASGELQAVVEEVKERRDAAGRNRSTVPEGKDCLPSSGGSGASGDGGGSYDDMIRQAKELKAKADTQITRFSRKTTISRGITLAVIVVIIGLAVYMWTSGFFRYAAAKMEGMAGMYESSYSRFYKLGDYLDSRSQYVYYKEKYLQQRVQDEGKSLSEAKEGDSVSFSGFRWKVLEKDGTKLLLICTAPKEESSFFGIPFDGKTKELREETDLVLRTEQVTEETPGKDASEGNTDTGVPSGNGPAGSALWETSSLRRYLNEAVLNHDFTPVEAAAILPQTSAPSENGQFGTKSGKETEDRISILSLEQIQDYTEKGVFRKPSVDMWIRTPGHDMGSAAYMTAKGNIILYGNDVADDNLSACPVILVDCTALRDN